MSFESEDDLIVAGHSLKSQNIHACPEWDEFSRKLDATLYSERAK